MPDPVVILKAMSMAAALAAVILGIFGWRGRTGQSAWINAGWALSVAAGLYLGCWILGIWPHWPPRRPGPFAGRGDSGHRCGRVVLSVSQDSTLVHLDVAFGDRGRWGSGITTWVGLHHRPDRAGDERMVTGSDWAYLFGTGRDRGGGVGRSQRPRCQAPGSSVPLSLAIVIAGSAVTIMLSGYSTGGQVGLPLAAALTGATVHLGTITSNSTEDRTARSRTRWALQPTCNRPFFR